MNEQVIPAEITHLDFELEAEKGPACDGWRLSKGGVYVRGSESSCPNRAEIQVVWSCCGVIHLYCRDCYNAIRMEIANQYKEMLHGKHPLRKRKPFAKVEFL